MPASAPEPDAAPAPTGATASRTGRAGRRQAIVYGLALACAGLLIAVPIWLFLSAKPDDGGGSDGGSVYSNEPDAGTGRGGAGGTPVAPSSASEAPVPAGNVAPGGSGGGGSTGGGGSAVGGTGGAGGTGDTGGGTAPGQQGPAGPRGPQGPEGPAGPQGPPGEQGSPAPAPASTSPKPAPVLCDVLPVADRCPDVANVPANPLG